MILYRFRHKPTGLFFKNRKFYHRRNRYGVGTFNLDENGTVYVAKPPGFEWIKAQQFNSRTDNTRLPFVESDWEIVAIDGS